MAIRRITCFCEHQFDADVADVVDLGVDADAERRILAGEFMDVSCPLCGKVLKPEFPCRIRHDARGIDIAFFPSSIGSRICAESFRLVAPVASRSATRAFGKDRSFA